MTAAITRTTRLTAALTAALAAVCIAVALSACTAAAPAPSTTPAPPAKTPDATATATTPPSAPALQPKLSAEKNVPFFDLTNTAVVAADAGAGGRAFIDALVAAGFDKTAMQVTPDRTAVNLAADSVQFSVLFNGKCLIGQYGPASGGYHSAVAPPTAGGACLVGGTRPIDW